jgi:hypothetical protein
LGAQIWLARHGSTTFWQVAEKRSRHVILSGAKDLLFCDINNLRDSSSPSAPQNDNRREFFSNLLSSRFWHTASRTVNRAAAPGASAPAAPLKE